MPRCPRCRGERTVKHGHIHNGKRRFRCKGCGRQFVPDPARPRISPEKRAIVDRLLRERVGLAGIARAVGVCEAWARRRAAGKFRAAPAPAPTAGEKKGAR